MDTLRYRAVRGDCVDKEGIFRSGETLERNFPEVIQYSGNALVDLCFSDCCESIWLNITTKLPNSTDFKSVQLMQL